MGIVLGTCVGSGGPAEKEVFDMEQWLVDCLVCSGIDFTTVLVLISSLCDSNRLYIVPTKFLDFSKLIPACFT